MDTQALQKILAHLMSSVPTGEELSGIIATNDGQIKLVITSGSEVMTVERLRELLEKIAENVSSLGVDEQPVVEAIGLKTFAVVMKSGGMNIDAGLPDFGKPTLRDSVNSVWPW